ncbi:MAG: hypothetical protein JXR53_08655 [Bacteroidales bacterium]|nr:hypothetical protein [Bacteroidales bacterium]
MEKRSTEKSLNNALLFLPVIGFLAFFFMRAFTFHLHDDDFWVLKYCTHGNFFGDFQFWWQHNNGRYASALLQMLFMRLPQSSTVLSSAVFCLSICLLASRSFFRSLEIEGYFKTGNLIIYSSILTAAIYLSSPQISDVFFWPSSIFVHGLSVAAFLLTVSWLINPSKLGFLLAIISSIFLGGASETAAILALAIIIFAYFFKKNSSINIIIPFGLLITGMLIHYFAPASLARSNLLANASNLSFIKAAMLSAFLNIKTAFFSLIILFIMVWPLTHLFTEKLKKIKQIRILVLLPLGMAFIHTLFIALIMRDAEPPRAAQAISLFLLLPAAYLHIIFKTDRIPIKIRYLLPTIVVIIFILLEILVPGFSIQHLMA